MFLKRGLILVTFLGLVGIGCSSARVVGLKKSADFTYDNVYTGRLAVAGFTSSVEEMPKNQKISYANMLKSEILEKQGSLSVGSTGMVQKKLGDKRYNQLMSEFEEMGTINPSLLSNLKNNRPQRFLVFARVESNDVEQDRDENTHYDKYGTPDYTTITSKASRSMNVGVQVYDLLKNEISWQGTLTRTMTNSNDFRKEEEGGLVKLVKAIKGTQAVDKDAKYPYPAAPKARVVLTQIFKGFAENLPEKED